MRPALDRYLKRVYAYCLNCLGDHPAAEDATQTALAKAWTNLHRFEPGSFERWLFRIARNVVIDLQRQQSRHGWAQIENFEAIPETAPAPGVQVETNVAIQDISDLMLHLPAPDRELLSLRLQGFSSGEIAVMTGESANTIYQRQFRAAKRLKALMAGEHQFATSDQQRDRHHV